jgi:hypothetical protein
MKKVLLVAALVAALGLGSASFATYAGGAVGYMAASGFTFAGQFGDWNMLGADMGLRARLGVGLGWGGFGLAGGADFTYNFGQIFSPDLPMILYIVGGPEVSYEFSFGTFALAINAGAGVQYNFSESLGVFFETKPAGVGFVLSGPASGLVFWAWGASTGVNFTF